MSGILQIQRRHAELFRIRLGDKTSAGVPQRLVNQIRVTSTNRKVVEAFGEVYGARAMRWDDRGKQAHQVYLPISRLPITLLPGQTLQQSMELWAGSTCQRRCDSVTMSDGKPCACGADEPIAERDCKPVSRLTVACPDVPIVGVGVLTTRSVIAAGELDASIGLAQGLLDQGRSVNATLRIDQMVTPGHKFAVPRIELEGITFQDIALAAQSMPALGPAETLALMGGE